MLQYASAILHSNGVCTLPIRLSSSIFNTGDRCDAGFEGLASPVTGVRRISVVYPTHVGMQGFRQRDTGGCVLLSGMATVPDTHSLQPILAKSNVLAAAKKAVDGLKTLSFDFTPALAVA